MLFISSSNLHSITTIKSASSVAGELLKDEKRNRYKHKLLKKNSLVFRESMFTHSYMPFNANESSITNTSFALEIIRSINPWHTK